MHESGSIPFCQTKDDHLPSVSLPGHLFTCLVCKVTLFSTWQFRRDVEQLENVQGTGLVIKKNNQHLLEERKKKRAVFFREGRLGRCVLTFQIC